MNVQPFVNIPSIEEIELAMKILKNYKAPGEDGLTSEFITAGERCLAEQIHKLILDI